MKDYFECFIAKHFTQANAKSLLGSDTVAEARFRNITQDDLEQFSVNVTIVEMYEATLEHHYQKIKTKAAEFMKYVKQEYNLKEE